MGKAKRLRKNRMKYKREKRFKMLNDWMVFIQKIHKRALIDRRDYDRINYN